MIGRFTLKQRGFVHVNTMYNVLGGEASVGVETQPPGGPMDNASAYEATGPSSNLVRYECSG